MQFATRRLADIMIDLFVFACVISRVSDSLSERGTEKSIRELEILAIFSSQVLARVKSHFERIDDNDDELIKSLADFTFEHEKFMWDNL
jgi:hypothetical protein